MGKQIKINCLNGLLAYPCNHVIYSLTVFAFVAHCVKMKEVSFVFDFKPVVIRRLILSATVRVRELSLDWKSDI